MLTSTLFIAAIQALIADVSAQTPPGFNPPINQQLQVAYGANTISPAGKMVARPGKFKISITTKAGKRPNTKERYRKPPNHFYPFKHDLLNAKGPSCHGRPRRPSQQPTRYKSTLASTQRRRFESSSRRA
jgi:hypothetical protein